GDAANGATEACRVTPPGTRRMAPPGVARTHADRPARRPSRAAAWSKNAARSVTTFSNWPNNSKLTRPNSPDQAISAPAATSSGTRGRIALRSRTASGRNDSGTGNPGAVLLACSVAGPGAPLVPARYASLMIFPNTAATRDAG